MSMAATLSYECFQNIMTWVFFCAFQKHQNILSFGNVDCRCKSFGKYVVECQVVSVAIFVKKYKGNYWIAVQPEMHKSMVSGTYVTH